MATRMNQYKPQTVSHPGETLSEKLAEMGMSVKEFAVRTTKPEKTIIAVIKGESSVTPDMSVAFENVTKIPASFWMNHQRLFDECEARNKRAEAIEAYTDWAKLFPYAAMVKLGWIRTCASIQEKAEELLNFFAVSTPMAWNNYYMNQQLKVAFRISLASTKEPYAISAWLRKGELQAADAEILEEYTEKKLREKIPAMKQLMASNSADIPTELKKMCASCGIKLLYTPCLPKAPISGSTRWINNVPCIQLSGRHNRYDTFWFSFFHEIGHILLHGKKEIFLESIDYDDKQTEKENEADDFAARILLAPSEEEAIIKGGDFSEKAIASYAEQFGTHPSVIVGRLQHKKYIKYWQNSQLVSKMDLFCA